MGESCPQLTLSGVLSSRLQWRLKKTHTQTDRWLAHRGSSTQGAVSLIGTAAKAHQTYVTAHTDYLMLYVSRDPGLLLLAHVLFS